MLEVIRPVRSIRLTVEIDEIENINEFMFVKCLATTCVNNLPALGFCNLKHIRVGANGVCRKYVAKIVEPVEEE